MSGLTTLGPVVWPKGRPRPWLATAGRELYPRDLYWQHAAHEHEIRSHTVKLIKLRALLGLGRPNESTARKRGSGAVLEECTKYSKKRADPAGDRVEERNFGAEIDAKYSSSMRLRALQRYAFADPKLSPPAASSLSESFSDQSLSFRSSSLTDPSASTVQSQQDAKRCAAMKVNSNARTSSSRIKQAIIGTAARSRTLSTVPQHDGTTSTSIPSATLPSTGYDTVSQSLCEEEMAKVNLARGEEASKIIVAPRPGGVEGNEREVRDLTRTAASQKPKQLAASTQTHPLSCVDFVISWSGEDSARSVPQMSCETVEE
ncbi:hypothetical protein CBER1_08730 [Cercospora berteroae]|uniref:Uncharacterized protein n=1 Tax=Cercospora berteroae TaxID=357750 RepID=A0A2S6CAB2_9PEZI|nr:hypothetical protein CBER1_08730 [Cercospora berteroae]